MDRGKPAAIEVRAARVHNLKNIDIDVPLNCITGIAGVSGSGKSSLALGVLYAEGSRRYLESLSTYTRRRMTQAAKASVDEVRYIPAALALHQRPSVPGIRSTFGTSTELLNSIRLMFSRLANHVCPNGHLCPPTISVAAMKEILCPVCGEVVTPPSAEELSFNSQGACPRCGGTGVVRTVDEAALIPDESLTIDEGAVLPWGSLMWSLMTDVCRAMGVRTDVPYRNLTADEKEIVLHGPAVKKHILYKAKGSNTAGEMDFTYFSAVRTVENALSKVKDERGMKRVERFLHEGVCPDCGGTRLSPAARAPILCGKHLDDVCKMTLKDLCVWVDNVAPSLSEEMRPMAQSIADSFHTVAARLVDLGLSYLSLDRASSTLSTGERQRVSLARSVRNRTTGVLYVLDEPSIGLHPKNIVGLTAVMRDLVSDGNSVVLVDHDTAILREADYLIEMGRAAGRNGGTVIAQGTVDEVSSNAASVIAPFLRYDAAPWSNVKKEDVFSLGTITLKTRAIHTVKPLTAQFPKGRLTVVTGVSGSGKTTLVLESLVSSIAAVSSGRALPAHVENLEAAGISRVLLIDATPIGINVRSTVATYAEVHDELRKIYAATPAARLAGYKAGDFSYNTGNLRCAVCDGTGEIGLDVQFLPDVNIPCPACHGSRYAKEAYNIKLSSAACIANGVSAASSASSPCTGNVSTGSPSANSTGIPSEASLPDLMAMDIKDALAFCLGIKGSSAKSICSALQTLCDLGLGYLTLGEQTPSLSGGEAQRLKLMSQIGRAQSDTVFVFDEPTIGLHPLDVRSLLGIFYSLISQGATVIVIEHDTDVIRAADWMIDMGPGGGDDGGNIIACGTPHDMAANPSSVTGKYLASLAR